MRIRSLLLIPAAVAAAGLAAAPGAGAKGFTYGITAGDVSSNSALLWTRTDKTGSVTLHVSADKHFGNADDIVKSLTSKSTNDNTVTVKVGHLQAGHVYLYRFTKGKDKSLTGRFVTPPKANTSRTIKFAYSGDADGTPAAGQTAPFWNKFQVYSRMAKENNDFNVNLGDTIYSDSPVGATFEGGAYHPHTVPALTLAEKWAKYRQNLALSPLQAVRRATGMYNLWDDHEFIDDFARSDPNGAALYQAGMQAFGNYMPAKYSSQTGLYRSFRWGKNLEVFMPDLISFRSAKAGASGVCNNPDTGNPDVAPNLPQSKRDQFAVLYPPLSKPVSQACLDKIADPTRTMLGANQLALFENAVKSSKARWKIVLNEVPITQTYLFPYDQWEGYAAERTKLLTYLQANAKNVVFLTTDAHWTYFADARLKTLEPGGPVDSGVKELVTGPAAVGTWGQTLNALTGNPGTANAVGNVFYRAAPPQGAGLGCVSLFSFSYAEVKVTPKAVTLTPKDINGSPVKETTSNGDTGPKCGPYTITAK
ncbi:MAG: hypothetical protein QOK25_1240 [Thermoleophilaceae bacterium]|nr:hypothetical protein [Thermoleophilaceae bacterium]